MVSDCATALAPPSTSRRACAGTAQLRIEMPSLKPASDSRDGKMVVQQCSGKFAAYYYAGKKKCLLGNKFCSFEEGVLARRAAALQFKPQRLKKAEAGRLRRALGDLPKAPSLDRHYELLNLLKDKLHPFGVEVHIVANRASFWAENVSLLVRPLHRARGDDKLVAIKVKHCGKLVEGVARFKDLSKVTTDYLLCVYADNLTQNSVERSWLFPTADVSFRSHLCIGMSPWSIATNRWNGAQYSTTYLESLASAILALPRQTPAFHSPTYTP